MNDFDGLVAMVTGGASGIGAEVAAMLGSRGAQVATLDLTAHPAYSVGGHSVVCDVGDGGSVAAAVHEVVSVLGRIDVLINNAGVGAQGTVADNPDDEWARVLNINVISVARVSRAALPYLKVSTAPSIVNISSVVANVGIPNRALYAASKGAVQALTLAMAADHLTDGIRVNCVTPGTTNTPWVSRLLDAADDPEAERTALAARQPLGRLVEPSEVALAIAYLASPLAGSTTGTSLSVDGGMATIRIGRK